MRSTWWLIIALLIGRLFALPTIAQPSGPDRGGSVRALDGGSGEPPPPKP